MVFDDDSIVYVDTEVSLCRDWIKCESECTLSGEIDEQTKEGDALIYSEAPVNRLIKNAKQWAVCDAGQEPTSENILIMPMWVDWVSSYKRSVSHKLCCREVKRKCITVGMQKNSKNFKFLLCATKNVLVRANHRVRTCYMESEILIPDSDRERNNCFMFRWSCWTPASLTGGD